MSVNERCSIRPVFDQGGALLPGATTFRNDTGKPIPVLPNPGIKPAPWMHENALKLVNFGGYAVMERSDLLKYDEMVFDRVARVIVVGERRHLAYLLDIQAIKEAMRADLRDQLATFAESIGLAYPLETR